jgi:hypothetical protein
MRWRCWGCVRGERDGKRVTHGKHQRDTPAHGLRAVELAGLGEPELLGAGLVLPADHGRAIQQNLDALARRQDGGHFLVAVGDAHLRLGRQPRGRGERGGFVGAVDHVEVGRWGLD